MLHQIRSEPNISAKLYEYNNYVHNMLRAYVMILVRIKGCSLLNNRILISMNKYVAKDIHIYTYINCQINYVSLHMTSNIKSNLLMDF